MIVMLAAGLCWVVDVYLLTQRSLAAAAVVVVVVLPNISDVYYLQSGRKQRRRDPHALMTSFLLFYVLVQRRASFVFPTEMKMMLKVSF